MNIVALIKTRQKHTKSKLKSKLQPKLLVRCLYITVHYRSTHIRHRTVLTTFPLICLLRIIIIAQMLTTEREGPEQAVMLPRTLPSRPRTLLSKARTWLSRNKNY